MRLTQSSCPRRDLWFLGGHHVALGEPTAAHDHEPALKDAPNGREHQRPRTTAGQCPRAVPIGVYLRALAPTPNHSCARRTTHPRRPSAAATCSAESQSLPRQGDGSVSSMPELVIVRDVLRAVTGQIDYHWQAGIWPRIADLTDAEYVWEPAPNCWTLHPNDDGLVAYDFEWPPPEPPPFTTIAWRLSHVAAGCFRRAKHSLLPRAGLTTVDPAHSGRDPSTSPWTPKVP